MMVEVVEVVETDIVVSLKAKATGIHKGFIDSCT